MAHRSSKNALAGMETLQYPAEWSQHNATILGFPSQVSLPSYLRIAACQEIANLAGAISHFEPVRLYTRPEDVQLAQSMLSESTHGQYVIEIIPFETNHLWVRDTGPVYVQATTPTGDLQRATINFRFNEWGGKRPARGWPRMSKHCIQENHKFARNIIAGETGLTEITSTVCLEGGALVSDGEGTLIASESSIMGDTRNPGLTKEAIEDELHRLLNIEKVIWFPGMHGLDITDVHADAELQFVRPGVVVISRPHASAGQAWHDIHQQVLDALRHQTDAKGRHIEFHILDEPNPNWVVPSGEKDQEGPATNYVNFYYVNGGLILPKFGDDDADSKALGTMQRLHPERVVKQVYVNALPRTGGVIHCATQPVI